MNTQIEKQIAEEYQNGMTFSELQKKYSIAYKTIVKILDREGIPHSKEARQKGKPNLKNQRILTQEEENLVCEVYRKTGRASESAKAINGGQDVVRRCLKKYSLYRTQHEAIIQSPQNQRKYPVKDNYFDVETQNMAYILGLFASDGSVSKDTNEIKLSFSSIDEDFLKVLQKEVGGRPISNYTTQKGYKVSSWAFTSKHIKEQLANYNIVPQKTFTFSFPKNLEKKYWRDFIRGYFDGDGCISTAGPSAIRFSICSARRTTLETIIDYFYELGIPKTSILETKRTNILYYFQYSTVPTRKIYEILYYDGCLCLPRKKKKYEEILERNLKK